METSEIIKRVRQVEIKTRGLSRNIFAGAYHTAFKGRGMTFSEVREYGFGDDVRNIDWNVTARFNRPYVKVFEEERELTVMLLIDVSSSRDFGTSTKTKKNIINEIAATLAFSAIQNNDKIGAILFSDRIEKFIPPQKGRKHILYIIREMVGLKPQSKKTDIDMALRYFANAVKKRCTAFLISDFMSNESFREPQRPMAATEALEAAFPSRASGNGSVAEALEATNNFVHSLSIANRKHDVVALQVYDKRETEIPPVGLIKLKDAETNEKISVDSSNKKMRDFYKKYWENRQADLSGIFKQSRVDYVSVETNEDYVKALIKLFKQRA